MSLIRVSHCYTGSDISKLPIKKKKKRQVQPQESNLRGTNCSTFRCTTITAVRCPARVQNIQYLELFKECDWRCFRRRCCYEWGCQKMWGSIKVQREGEDQWWVTELCQELCLWDDTRSCMCYWSVWKEWNPRLRKDTAGYWLKTPKELFQSSETGNSQH